MATIRKHNLRFNESCVALFLFIAMLAIHLTAFSAESSSQSNSNWRDGIDKSTDVIYVAMPVATVAGVLISKDWEGLKQCGFTAAATIGVTQILKYTVKERRPDMSDSHSFPSGHASVTFANATFLQKRYGWKFGIPAYALATYASIGRVAAKKHHWWDVLAGAAIGAGSAYVFTTPWASNHDLSIATFADENHIGFSANLSF